MTLTFEELVPQLMRACNVDRTRAEQLARRHLGQPEPTQSPEEIERDARILEDREQWEIVKLFRAYGCKVYSLSQKRASKQTPGLADLYVTCVRHELAFWWETKRQVGGQLSTAQSEFQAENHACRVKSFVGDRYVAAAILVAEGLAVRDSGGVWGISPKGATVPDPAPRLSPSL